MIHTLQRIDAGSFEQQYQDITRLYLNNLNKTTQTNGYKNNNVNNNEDATMIIDLGKLEHINSLVLAFLLTLKRWAVANQTPYQIQQIPPHLEGLANVYGIAELLDIEFLKI